MTGAANIFKTELYVGINWGIQGILGMTSIVNIVAKNMPWNYANIETRMMYERVGKDINAISNYSHQFFRDKAPYKEAFDVTGFVLDIATLTSGIKSISNRSSNENIDANDSKAVDKPKVDNMNEFFEDSFGSSIKGSLKRTGSNFQS